MIIVCHPSNYKRLQEQLTTYKNKQDLFGCIHNPTGWQIIVDPNVPETRKTGRVFIKPEYENRFIEYDNEDITGWCLRLGMSYMEEEYVFHVMEKQGSIFNFSNMF